MYARIALVSTRDLELADTDELLLLPLLPEAEVAYWDDPETDWAAYDLVVLRSTWNYTAHLDEFLAWATRVSHVTRLVNPVEIIEWNTDKRYLADLAARGIPTVPTMFASPGEGVEPHAVAGHVVVKPSVGAGSKGARLFHGDPSGALAHVAALQAEGSTAMVQPYLEGVDEHGETALIFVGGEFSHAARKAAILSRDMSWSTGLYADEKVVPTTASSAELDLALTVLAELPGLAYARVDLLPTDTGPVVLELELTEPSLFLALDPGAPNRAAAAFRALLSQI
jgi:glutathione synthase/RimK-type ligase-like ATP-grasp enzyme